MSGEEGEGLIDDNVIPWEDELGDDTLSQFQSVLGVEYGVEFEDLDGVRGISEDTAKPFFTDFGFSFEFQGEEVCVEIEQDGELHNVRYYTEDPNTLNKVGALFEEYSADEADIIIEPYVFEKVRDTDVYELIRKMEDDLEIEGPKSRPGSGTPRMYAVREEHLDIDQEDDNQSYSMTGYMIPGDAKYDVNGVAENQADFAFDLDGSVEFKPVKRSKGCYDVLVDGENEESLFYMIDTVRTVINSE